MRITLVKKLLRDGSPCAKCADVLQKLEEGGYMDRIDRILDADERDPKSPGMELAQRYQVNRAPFFLVEKNEAPEPEIYTVYLQFVREVLGTSEANQRQSENSEELKELMKDNPDLDFL